MTRAFFLRWYFVATAIQTNDADSVSMWWFGLFFGGGEEGVTYFPSLAFWGDLAHGSLSLWSV